MTPVIDGAPERGLTFEVSRHAAAVNDEGVWINAFQSGTAIVRATDGSGNCVYHVLPTGSAINQVADHVLIGMARDALYHKMRARHGLFTVEQQDLGEPGHPDAPESEGRPAFDEVVERASFDEDPDDVPFPQDPPHRSPILTLTVGGTEYFSMGKLRALLIEVDKDYAGAHVNAGGVISSVRRAIMDALGRESWDLN